MTRWDNMGLLWQDPPPQRRGGPRILGPIPPIPETGWRPPTEFPNIRDAKAIAFDLETYDPELDSKGPGWATGTSHIVGASFAVDGGQWYFPIRHEVQPELNMDHDKCMEYFAWALGGDGVKIGANLMYDVGGCEAQGIKVNGLLYDVQIAESLLNETSVLALEDLGLKYMGKGKDSDILEEWCRDYYGTGVKNWRKDIYRAPTSLVGHYGEGDARLPYDILLKQWPQLERRGLLDLFHMECGLIRLLIAMRFKGVAIDVEYAHRLSKMLEGKEKLIQEELNRVAGMQVEINKPYSIADAFDKAGLTYPRTAPSERAPTGNPSFVKEWLSAHKHPIAQLITQARDMSKLRGTFVDGYLKGKTTNGRLHGQFHLTKSERGGTRTGRLSSSDPNLQNIPTRTEEGKLIRQAFVPSAGLRHWRKIDLSQIEYRFLAHYAYGPHADALRERYNADHTLDFHNLCGDLIFEATGKRLARGPVKSINFGFVYGLGKQALADQLGMSLKDANALSKAYHEGAPFAADTLNHIQDETKRTGIVSTILGRESHFDMWEPKDWEEKTGYQLPRADAELQWVGQGIEIERAFAYRSINYKFQGSAADQMKKAMLDCFEQGVFDATGLPLLTVHDELDFEDLETPESVEGYKEVVRIMENCIPLKVPVFAETEVGPNWGEVKKISA